MMKHLFTITLFLAFSFTVNAQFRVKLSKSQRKEIKFKSETVDDGYKHYFLLEGVKTGPAIDFGSDKIEFFQYSKKGVKQGTYIIMKGDKIEIGSYKNGLKHGNNFTTEKVNQVIDVAVYKKGKEKKNLTRQYLDNPNPIVSDIGKGERNGFSNWSDGEAQLIGWWKLPHIKSPGLVRNLKKGSSLRVYIGDFNNKNGKRRGFGLYIFKDGQIELTYTGKDYKYDGLYISFDAGGKVRSANYYKNDELTMTYYDEDDK